MLHWFIASDRADVHNALAEMLRADVGRSLVASVSKLVPHNLVKRSSGHSRAGRDTFSSAGSSTTQTVFQG